MVRLEDCAWPKRKLVQSFLELAQAMERQPAQRSAGPAVAERALSARPLLVYGRWRDNLGMGRCAARTPRAKAIGAGDLPLLSLVGINVKQLYG